MSEWRVHAGLSHHHREETRARHEGQQHAFGFLLAEGAGLEFRNAQRGKKMIKQRDLMSLKREQPGHVGSGGVSLGQHGRTANADYAVKWPHRSAWGCYYLQGPWMACWWGPRSWGLLWTSLMGHWPWCGWEVGHEPGHEPGHGHHPMLTRSTRSKGLLCGSHHVRGHSYTNE